MDAINAAGTDSYTKIADVAGNNDYEGWRTEITYVPHVSVTLLIKIILVMQ